MPAFIDLTDEKFGRLTVIERAEKDKHGGATWKCRCACGNVTVIMSDSLRSGNTQSCGCLRKERQIKAVKTHGMHKTKEYNTWDCMIQRCNNPKNPGYENYGGRGITVCDKWLKFENFFEDMGEKPKGLTLERRDNMVGYCKSNCCWATYTIQARNQRIPKNNKTGTRGVCWNKWRGKYQVSIRTGNNKQLYIGRFVELEQAVEARKKAEQRYWGKNV